MNLMQSGQKLKTYKSWHSKNYHHEYHLIGIDLKSKELKLVSLKMKTMLGT